MKTVEKNVSATVVMNHDKLDEFMVSLSQYNPTCELTQKWVEGKKVEAIKVSCKREFEIPENWNDVDLTEKTLKILQAQLITNAVNEFRQTKLERSGPIDKITRAIKSKCLDVLTDVQFSEYCAAGRSDSWLLEKIKEGEILI